jgi:acyl-CoA thioester hydrolase
MRVVYHANYLNWFEIARTELIRELGMPYREIEPRGLLLPVVDAELKFIQPARYDDLVCIYTKIVDYSNIKIQFVYEIRRIRQEETEHSFDGAEDLNYGEPQGDLLVSGMTRHVWVSSAWKPARIDKEAPDLFELIRSNFSSVKS